MLGLGSRCRLLGNCLWGRGSLDERDIRMRGTGSLLGRRMRSSRRDSRGRGPGRSKECCLVLGLVLGLGRGDLFLLCEGRCGRCQRRVLLVPSEQRTPNCLPPVSYPLLRNITP